MLRRFGTSRRVAPTGPQFYAAPGGSDGTGTGTFLSPWKTFEFSTGQLDPGDTLNFRGGTYLGQFSQNYGGPNASAGAPIVVRNYPGETPIFDAEGASEYFAVIGDTVDTGDYLTIRGLTVQNYANWAFWSGYDGSSAWRVNNLSILNCVIKNIGTTSLHHGIYGSYGNVDPTFANNIIMDISGYPIHGYHNPGMLRAAIYNNLCARSGYGIAAASGARDCKIINNTVIDVGTGSGVDISGPNGEPGEGDDDHNNYDSIVRNNLLVNTAAPGVGSSGAITPTITHNHFFNSSTTGGGTNTTTGDPLFVNAGADDYHLGSSSPAINNGTTTDAPSTDLDGAARPQGTIDRGCYERA